MNTSSLRVAGLVLATTLTGGALAAAPAVAADRGAQGRVVSAGALTVRYGPSTATPPVGSVASGKTIELVCKTRGTSVAGNDLWYALPPTLNEWVSARYVSNVGAAPDWCGSEARYGGRTTAVLTARTGPTRAATSAGTLSRGATVAVVCKLPGQVVAGNALWYSLTSGRWVSARYVTNVGAAPGWCN